MKTLELNGREIGVVVVPIRSWNFSIKNDKLFYEQNSTNKQAWHSFHQLPSGQWQILGRPSEITEDVARGLVSWFELEGQLGYRDYSHDDPRFPFRTATESLLSWCKANGITEKHILLIKNKDNIKHTKIIDELTAEVERLRGIITQYQTPDIAPPYSPIP